MKLHILATLFYCVFISFNASAQTDAFVGTWEMEYLPSAAAKPITISLQVGPAEKALLYPAEMKLQCDSFIAVYHLLLVKRNIRQLSIGKNKIPASEMPFSIGNWTIWMNGVFDLSKDIKGTSFLSVDRMAAKQYGVNMPDPSGLNQTQKTTATHLRDFLKDAEIKLKKMNNDAFESPYTDTILTPGITKDYYGISNMITVKDRKGTVNLSNNKKNTGVVSAILNGNTIVDLNSLSVRKPVEDIKLDTGLNILLFFADSYGKTVTSTGNMAVEIGDKRFSLDFANKNDVAATFIVAKIYYSPDKEKENNSELQNSILRELSQDDLQRDIKNYHYPDPSGRNLLQNDSAKKMAEQWLLRNAKPVGTIKTSSRQIILALWDDAVEDGDSISLSINGNWVVQGFKVKKQPQFISVTIDPGPNKLLFVANNLGAIPPNTSVLEIIDGKQRKAFMLETDLTDNNSINILYDARPD